MPHLRAYGHLSAYSWDSDPTKQVAFVTIEGHIHELYFGRDDKAWRHVDLTDQTQAPSASPIFTLEGYGWNSGGSKQVVYGVKDNHSGREDGHIHELYFGLNDKDWRHIDLTELAQAPSASHRYAIQGYSWDSDPTKQVVYGTEDGHIHELYFGLKDKQWRHVDLTELAQAPPASSIFTIEGYSWETGGSKQVVYGTEDGHIHELYFGLNDKDWRHVDLTELAQAPPASSIFTIEGYSWDSDPTKQVIYGTEDGHIHELYFGLKDKQWRHADLTNLAQAPPVAPIFTMDGYGWTIGGPNNTDSSKQVVYGTEDGHIHELYFGLKDKQWRHADLTNLAQAPIAYPSYLMIGYSWEADPTKQVVYGTRDGHIHELYFGLNDKDWRHADLTELAQAPPAVP